MPVQIEKIAYKIAPCSIVQILLNTIKFHHIHVRHREENRNGIEKKKLPSYDDDEAKAISVHFA